MIVGGIVAIAANAVLTRPLGLAGAVIAYCLTQAVVAIMTVVAFRDSSGVRAAGDRQPDAGNAEQQLSAVG